MIVQYELVAPVTDRKSPYLDGKGFFICPAIKKVYKYYVEVKRYNPNTLCYEYFLLLSDKKFDAQCRKCRVDDYGRLKAILHNEVKQYVIAEIAARGNVRFEYVESDSLCDVWQIL